MKRFVALALGIVASVGLAIVPASAGAFVGQPSVFPTIRDPWADWPRRAQTHTTVVVPVPSAVFVTPGVVGAPVVSQPVWVPGQWAWNGYYWVWVPEHWSF